MSFGNILGQILQDGLGQAAPTRSRLETSARNLGQGGQGINDILGSLQESLGRVTGGPPTPAPLPGAPPGATPRASAGGFADKARDFMQKDQVGGLSGAQVTGIGALAGALLGGGVGGAARGSAMAVLGTLALGALKGARARAEGGQPGTGTRIEGKELKGVAVDPAEIEAVTAPDAERLLVRAMIAAAKSDGKLDETEVKGILGRLGSDAVTEDEKAFVLAEMRAPLDIDALAKGVRNQAQAAQIYGASLLAVNVDTAGEQQYLRALAQKLRLDAGVVTRLHEMTGAPAV